MEEPDQSPQQVLLFPNELAPGEYVIPVGASPATCKSCNAPIVWAKTNNDTFIPLSLATARACNGQRVATTHFADCPQGRAWRRG